MQPFPDVEVLTREVILFFTELHTISVKLSSKNSDSIIIIGGFFLQVKNLLLFFIQDELVVSKKKF